MKLNITKHCVTILTCGSLITGFKYTRPKITEGEFPIKGHEVSEKVDINWEDYGDDFDYVVIRVGDGLHLDEKFEDNYKLARKNNVPVGVFIDNTLASEDYCDENRISLYAEYRYSSIKINQLIGKKIDYPVYLRIDYGDRPIEDALPKKHANSLFDRFELIMTHNDFIPGVYSNEHNIEYLRSVVDDFDSRFAYLLENEKKEELPVLKDYAERNMLTVNNPEEIAASMDNVSNEQETEVELEKYVYSKKNYHDRGSLVPVIILSMLDLVALSKLGYDKYKEKKEAETPVESFVVKL
ncbi:MAG: hypothetical protein Q4E69_06590 [Bacilli bacterium]|nr:hypothetical protein [Bacilli bacterium]